MFEFSNLESFQVSVFSLLFTTMFLLCVWILNVLILLWKLSFFKKLFSKGQILVVTYLKLIFEDFIHEHTAFLSLFHIHLLHDCFYLLSCLSPTSPSQICDLFFLYSCKYMCIFILLRLVNAVCMNMGWRLTIETWAISHRVRPRKKLTTSPSGDIDCL